MSELTKTPQSEVKKTPSKNFRPSFELVLGFEKYWNQKFIADPHTRPLASKFPSIKKLIEDAYFTGASVVVEGDHECLVCHQNTKITPDEQRKVAKLL
jgi:hypothetical protein